MAQNDSLNLKKQLNKKLENPGGDTRIYAIPCIIQRNQNMM